MNDQAETRALLSRLTGAETSETQISAVFVGKDVVFKLKKAVRLAFLDFTTLEARRHFVQRELALNAPAAPGLYRDVLPITRGPDGLRLGGEGEAVEWVLRMAPIPPGNFLLDQVASGLSDSMLDALGDMVAADHARRSPAPGHDPTHPGRNARGNAKAALDAGLPPERVAEWLSGAEQALDATTPLLAVRAAAGLVRRAHGDLHLGNICLWNGAPVPFDALEFDEAMATIDLGYDLAFLLMDLDRRAGRAAANRVLNRYVARTGDASLVRVLPAFLSRRAMVRAHVTGDAGYLDAALAYLRPARSRVVAIGGLPGTGKSTLARALAPALDAAPGALILRSDEIRKRLFGVAPERRLGREAYTVEANARVDAALLDQLRATAGHSVILDASFLSPTLRHAVAAASQDFTGIWLEAPIEELERRVRARSGDASDATDAVLHRLADKDPGLIDWHRVTADNSVVDRCRALLGLD
ncbi:AAA family ATPase [Acidisphaera sp. L21]|uniref:bifunctional aminoglycoside phosphotransferase/ATP-binding protein n=1 Tax=Acidisphaera sp. L21 TaxID=1641851 RepID=UPI0020B150C3|nr:AAA family ATPase [Acidisphaera sp. L21]